MSDQSARRNFVKRGALLGGGFLLTRPALADPALVDPTPGDPARADAAVEKATPKAKGGDNETLRTLQGMRTIHGNFTAREIPDDQVETILETCVRAANASNTQSYSIVVSRDRARMKELCGYAGSAFMVFCVDHNRILASARSLGHRYAADGIVSFVTAAINTALAAQTAAIAGRALGIDSLLTNGIHRGDMERLWKILDLPQQGCFPLIALVLGYPKEEPAHRRGRLTGAGVIHRERYHHLTPAETEEITRRYDDPEARLGLIEDWKAKGHAHYLDWLFESWLGGGEPLKTETQMMKLLKRSGFIDLQRA
jgi:nitroreductase